MSNNQIKLPKKTSNKPGGLLAALWLKVIKDTDLTPQRLLLLVSRYLSKQTGNNKTENRRAKATILKNITADNMTWTTFTHNIFQFLPVVKLDITMKLTYSDNSESVHSLSVDNVSTDITESSDEDTENKDKKKKE